MFSNIELFVRIFWNVIPWLITDSVQVDHKGSYAQFDRGVQIYKPSGEGNREGGIKFPIGVDLGEKTGTQSDAAGTRDIYQNGAIYTSTKDGLQIFIPAKKVGKKSGSGFGMFLKTKRLETAGELRFKQEQQQSLEQESSSE